MADPLFANLTQLLVRDSGLGRPELHAGLHRFCQANAQRLRNLLREPDWIERLVAVEQSLTSTLEQPGWRTALAQRSRWGNEDQALIFHAALLQALDEFHNKCTAYSLPGSSWRRR